MYDIFIKLATAFLEKIALEVDSKVSEKSTIRVDDSGVVLSTADYLQYAVYGRGPGKQPPIDRILEFVSKKGIIFENTDQEGTAWAIAKSISKKGTNNFVPGAPNALEEIIKNNLGEFNSILNLEILQKQTEEVNEAVRKAIPTDVKFKI